MSYFVDAIQIVLLAFIAIELYLLRRDLPRITRTIPRDSDESGVKGQTINVNVGTPVIAEPAAVSKTVEVVQPVEEQKADEIEEKPTIEDERARRAAERSKMDAAVRSTPSGLTVKKCPSCGMENTSYRTECFNCGSAL